MANHPNRGWRSRWTVDLARSTVSHRDGWEFRFSPSDGVEGGGVCIAQPEPLTLEHLARAERIAREAVDVYVEAQPDAAPRPAKRRVGRPTVIDGRRIYVYLDEESLSSASALGEGNISAGIRVALAQKNPKNLQKIVDK